MERSRLTRKLSAFLLRRILGIGGGLLQGDVEIAVDLAHVRLDPDVDLGVAGQGHVDVAVEGDEGHRLVAGDPVQDHVHVAVGRGGHDRAGDAAQLDAAVGGFDLDLAVDASTVTRLGWRLRF